MANRQDFLQLLACTGVVSGSKIKTTATRWTRVAMAAEATKEEAKAENGMLAASTVT
jgi:hypothetical protein